MDVTSNPESITFTYNYSTSNDQDVLFEDDQKALTDRLHAALVDAGITKGTVVVNY